MEKSVVNQNGVKLHMLTGIAMYRIKEGENIYLLSVHINRRYMLDGCILSE